MPGTLRKLSIFGYLSQNVLTVVRCCSIGILLGFCLWSSIRLELAPLTIALSVFLGFVGSIAYCRYLPITPSLTRIFYILLAFSALMMVFQFRPITTLCIILMLMLIAAIIGQTFDTALRVLSISYSALMTQMIIIALSSAGFLMLYLFGLQNQMLLETVLSDYYSCICLLMVTLIVYVEFITLRPGKQQVNSELIGDNADDDNGEDDALYESTVAKYEDKFREVAGQYDLTNRQCDVLRLLFKGRTAKYIAAQLYISPNTVKVHQRNIYQKLGISSQQELIDYIERKTLRNGNDNGSSNGL